MISLHELKAGRETLEVLQAIVNNIGEFRVNLDKLTTNEALQNAKDELNHTIANLESTTNTNLSNLDDKFSQSLETLRANLSDLIANLDDKLSSAKSELEINLANLDTKLSGDLAQAKNELSLNIQSTKTELVVTDTALDLRITALENKPIPPTGVQKVILDSSSGNVIDIVEVPVVNNEITLPNANFSVSVGPYNPENPNSDGRNLILQKATYDENTKKIQFDNQFNIYAHQNVIKIDGIEISPKSITDTQILNLQTQINEINANSNGGETNNYFTPTPILSGFTGIVTTTSPSDEISVVGNLPIGFVWWNKQEKRYFINKGINPSDETKLLWQEVKYAKDLYDDNNGITWELVPFDEIEIKGGGSNQNYGFCISNLQLTDINGVAYTEPKAGEVIDGVAYPANTNATAKRFILIDGEKYYFSISAIDLSIYGGSWARSPMVKSESGDYNAAANSILLGYSVATSGKDPNGKATKNFTLKIKFEKPLPLKIFACDFYSPKVGNYASSITEAADHYLEVRLKQNDMTISGFRFENIEAYSGISAYCAKFRVATNCVGEIYLREFGADNIKQYVANWGYKPSILLD